MPLSDVEERLLSYLRDHPGSSPREMADALGEPIQRIRAALTRLRDRGLVARGEEGRYYAVAPLPRGPGRRELRRPHRGWAGADVEALAVEVEELKKRLRELEERVRELERRCGLA